MQILICFQVFHMDVQWFHHIIFRFHHTQVFHTMCDNSVILLYIPPYSSVLHGCVTIPSYYCRFRWFCMDVQWFHHIIVDSGVLHRCVMIPLYYCRFYHTQVFSHRCVTIPSYYCRFRCFTWMLQWFHHIIVDSTILRCFAWMCDNSIILL